MAIGYYTPAFESAISPFTTLGPLALVISFSLLVEGLADLKRHKNDAETNNAPCVILKRTDEFELEKQRVESSRKSIFKCRKEGSKTDTFAEGAVERDPKICGGRDVLVNIDKAFYAEASTPAHKATTAAAVAAEFEAEMNKRKSSGNTEVDSAASEKKETPVTPTTKQSGHEDNMVKVSFQRVRRMDIHQGHFVLVKNREMVPADMLLLASSNDQGSAYIETSSIDGETNLKLRTSPQLPKSVLRHLRDGTSKNPLQAIGEEGEEEERVVDEDEDEIIIESIEDATKRLTRFSYLGRPAGKSALDHPEYEKHLKGVTSRRNISRGDTGDRGPSFFDKVKRTLDADPYDHGPPPGVKDDGKFIAALTTEPPNPSVHTFSGKLTLPPFETGGTCFDIALDAENVLLRGAVVRNTEWVIGVVFFTGTDTKLVQNSFKTKSKFSQLDRLMNWTVVAILLIMIISIAYLSSQAVVTTNEMFDQLWYVGFNKNETEKWPYLDKLDPPPWNASTSNWIQMFFLYVTLLSNFIPLSLYITVEFITFAMLWFIYSDLDMYDDTTNTRAVARSTVVTDLGRIQYIFSDKTGTLTQNVMRFKRCTVDGIVFGAPIQKSRPGAEVEEDTTPFYPLRQLLVGRFKGPGSAGLEGLGDSTPAPADNLLTFNAEMFLRVMSLCHTVVVEKDIDKKETIGAASSVASVSSKKSLTGLFTRRRTNTSDSLPSLPPLAEEQQLDFSMSQHNEDPTRPRTGSVESIPSGQLNEKSADGAPMGYAYQAESPDEGALVSAASKSYGFQVISRDSAGIKLSLTAPSHLQNSHIVERLKSGGQVLKHIAAETAEEVRGGGEGIDSQTLNYLLRGEERTETWTILAVNKFDSDRKRMSILLRSPPELGDLPILFCKGADSAMLDPAVAASSQLLQPDGSFSVPKPPVSGLTTVGESDEDDNNGVDADAWEMGQILGLQAHLGDFASEGLRTLVLGMRILSEEECTEWLEEYKAASTSMTDRAKLLTDAAVKIESGLHIVGATAIEDKLQKNVPDTIAQLGKAGIKLWVLTGDKRETAVEIGYSTHVLSSNMHLTEVPDNGKLHVRTQMAMEFIRLIKIGKLPLYQKTALDPAAQRSFRQSLETFRFYLSKCWRSFRRLSSTGYVYLLYAIGCWSKAKDRRDDLEEKRVAELNRVSKLEQRRRVRKKAEDLIQTWLNSEEGMNQRKQHHENEELSLASDEMPAVFNRATSAKSLLNELKTTGKLSGTQLRELSLAQLTVNEAGDDEPLVDEDALSMDSFVPSDLAKTGNFDKKKRTILERLFAIDREVRKGQLRKHLKKEKLSSIKEEHGTQSALQLSAGALSGGPRALVIEGSALKHLLGNPEMEAILFAVASNCDAVIACRVSPKQKALLLNLVRHNIRPEPITLAIGDGANDVGMIQEAHVGIGISGKEGKQAVNASDFAIAQFRFLEDLLLIHGRWNFFRQSTVVLFSFYKNALLAGILICYAPDTIYSGQPLFDEWLIAMLNFVAGVPIIVLGLFDRCLSKQYVKKHPEVYKASRENELITFRVLARWVVLAFVHIFALFYFTVPQQSKGGGVTPAWLGLMTDKDRNWPGDGEGGDLKSVGTVTFTCLVILLAYKVCSRVIKFVGFTFILYLHSILIPILTRYYSSRGPLFMVSGQLSLAVKAWGKDSRAV